MNNQNRKSYFRESNTVVRWWEPEQSNVAHLYSQEVTIIRSLINSCSSNKVLDVACGKGRASKVFAPQSNIYSLDISYDMLEVTKERFPKNYVAQGDSENLPFSNNTFDVVICLEALVHMESPLKALKEFNRVLAPDGNLVISIDQASSLYSAGRRISYLLSRYFHYRNPVKGYDIWQPLKTSEIRDCLLKENLEIQVVHYLGVLAPVSLTLKNEKRFPIIPAAISKRFTSLSRFLDRLFMSKFFAKYAIIVARKPL